ncbi:2'-5' RNA ligase family protein [Pontibacter russatus]|uniref:2'-5' RNA ligase family protein n=1 Tax=Pontibacter russatus TaxID=2694929 RepID=UPI0013798DCC|nr:2'-5' RNA ligase family protein [Pontibacter russatus]
MNLEKHYDELWENALQKFQASAFEPDPFLNSAEDDRFGLTLLFRPDAAVKESIGAFLQELRQVEPAQYYYPASDLHVTVMSVISCHAGFRLADIDKAAYKNVLQECLAEVKTFRVNFRGITASPSCVMVQGFPASGQLNDLRDKLRESFRKTSLQQTMDSRYILRTAHITAVRFKEPLQNPAVFLEKLQDFRNRSFGGTVVGKVELVYNDWYQRQALVQRVDAFRLNQP